MVNEPSLIYIRSDIGPSRNADLSNPPINNRMMVLHVGIMGGFFHSTFEKLAVYFSFELEVDDGIQSVPGLYFVRLINFYSSFCEI